MVNKVPVMHVYPTNDIVIYKTEIKDNIAKISKTQIAKVGSENVFSIVDKTGRKTRRYKAVIHLDGKISTCQQQTREQMLNKILKEDTQVRKELGLSDSTLDLMELEKLPKEVNTLFEPLTLNDRAVMVKREIVKQMSRAKAMETWQFGILALLIVAGIVLNFVL